MKSPRIEIAPEIATNLNRILCLVTVSLTIFHYFVSYFTPWGTSLDVAHEQQTTPQHDTEESTDVVKFLPLLTFIPGRTPVISYPWVLLTSSFIEREMFLLLLVPLITTLFGSYVQKIWGLPEYVRYLAITALMPNLVLYIWYALESIVSTASPPLVFSGASMAMGIIVAASKLIPNHQIFLYRDQGFRVKRFPVIIMGFCVAAQVLSPSDIHKVYLLKTWWGFLVSWAYLRFFQKTPSSAKTGLLPPFVPKRNRNHVRPLDFHNVSSFSMDFNGDRSASFALSTFFPFPLSAIIGDIGNGFFSLLVRTKMVDRDQFEITEEPSLAATIGKVGVDSMSIRRKAQQVWSWARRANHNHSSSSVSNGKRNLALEELG